MDENVVGFAETPLGVTEKALHDKFRQLIEGNQYDEARKVADLMEKLSLI